MKKKKKKIFPHTQSIGEVVLCLLCSHARLTYILRQQESRLKYIWAAERWPIWGSNLEAKFPLTLETERKELYQCVPRCHKGEMLRTCRSEGIQSGWVDQWVCIAFSAGPGNKFELNYCYIFFLWMLFSLGVITTLWWSSWLQDFNGCCNVGSQTHRVLESVLSQTSCW